MPTKVVLFYNQQNRGWTETWYKPFETPPLDIPEVDEQIFLNAIAFRSPLTTLEWVRYSIVNNPQKVNSFRLSNRVAAPPNTEAGPDIVQTDALYRLITPSFARRTISLRGLFDSSVVRDPVTGAFKPSPFLIAGVTTYLQSVLKAGWQLQKTETTVNTPGLQAVNVTTVTPSPLNAQQAYITYSAPIAGLVVGNYVRFYGSIDPRLLPIFPRTAAVKEIGVGGANNITINYQLDAGAPVTPVGVRSTKLIYEYEGMLRFSFQALSKRDTGRPFGSSRGRRTSLGSRR